MEKCHNIVCSFLVLFLALCKVESHGKCNLDCGAGLKCVLRRSTCSYPPCEKYPICVDAENSTEESSDFVIINPGTCPEILTPGPCMEQCRQDADCRDGEKCCFNGCGNTCKPVQNVISGKPGSCPWNLRRQPMCGMDCTSDVHCPGSEKCCLTACGSTCSRPCYHWLQRSSSIERVGYGIWSVPYLCRPAF